MEDHHAERDEYTVLGFNPVFLLVHPNNRLGLDRVGGTIAGVDAAAAGQATDRSDRHVTVAGDLAAEANAAEPSRSQDTFFRRGHLRRFTGKELHPAGGAASIAAASVQLIDMGFIFQCQHQALA
jgi:hypothetical protein